MAGDFNWHELRVREQVSLGKWVKKSKFYEVRRPSDAVRIYKKHARVPFTVMWCGKNGHHSEDKLASQARQLFLDIRQEQALQIQRGFSISEFLGMGSKLLEELSEKDKNRSKYNKRRDNMDKR